MHSLHGELLPHVAQSDSLTSSCSSTTPGESSAWVASSWLSVLVQVKTFSLHSSVMTLMSIADISSGHKPVHLYKVAIIKWLKVWWWFNLAVFHGQMITVLFTKYVIAYKLFIHVALKAATSGKNRTLWPTLEQPHPSSNTVKITHTIKFNKRPMFNHKIKEYLIL